MTERILINGEEPPALTNWSNAPDLKDLKQDLMDAKPIHDAQKTRIAEWLDNLNVTGKAKVTSRNGSSSVVPKLIRKQAEWRYAALSEPFLSTSDVFKVEPITWEDKEGAEQNQLVLNNQLNTKIDKIKFIDEYVRTAVDEGTVIVRVGWCFQEEQYRGNFPTVEYRKDAAMAPMHEYIAAMKEEDPSKYEMEVPDELKQAHELTIEQEFPIRPVITGYEDETRTRVVQNHPTLEVCDYRNVIVDPTCNGDIDKANFLIYSFESSLSELEKEGKYKNLKFIQITSSSILGQPDHDTSKGSQSFNFTDEPRKKFVVHEYWGYWDIDGSGIVKPFVASWVGNVMIRLEENPFPDKKIPFVIEQYLPVRKNTHGEPDGALLEDNQKIVGAVTRGMIDIMGKSANGQTGIRKDMLDLTNRRRFERGDDYEFNQNVDPRIGVFQHVYPEIPQSAQYMVAFQNQEAESLTGVKSWSQGVSGATLGDVAAGVRGALDAASKRELGILRRLSNGMIKIGRKIISMNAEFLSEKEIIRVTNDKFVAVRRDDLPGNYDLRLTISTAEEDNNKAQELAFMLQTMGNNMDPAMSRMILADIAKLRKMPDLAKAIESYQPQPDPIMQEKAMLENELLKAQIRKENAQAEAAFATAGLNQAKVGTEGAKAQSLAADADQKTLDFVEQESGVKQERALQAVGEQARSQTQLKIVDNQMKREQQKEKVQADLVKEWVKTQAKTK